MPDKLTGLAAFHELEPASGGSATAILLDVNSLRFLNAQSGHEAADAALVATADTLKKYSEKLQSTRLFRIWGDEFLLLMSADHELDARDIAAALVDEVDRQNIPYTRPDHPEMDRLAVSALVFDLGPQEAKAMKESGPSPAFRDMFETRLCNEKRRSGGTRGVVVDARSSAVAGANTTQDDGKKQ